MTLPILLLASVAPTIPDPPKTPTPSEPKMAYNQSYGIWIDLPPETIVSMDFVDTDADGIDDRRQAGPGMPDSTQHDVVARTPKGSRPSDAFFGEGQPRHQEIPPVSSQEEAQKLLSNCIPLLQRAAESEDYKTLHLESYKAICASDYYVTSPPVPESMPLAAELSKVALQIHELSEEFLKQPATPEKKTTLQTLLLSLQNLTKGLETPAPACPCGKDGCPMKQTAP